MRNAITLPPCDTIRLLDHVTCLYRDVFNHDADADVADALPANEIKTTLLHVAANANDRVATVLVELDDYSCLVVASFDPHDQNLYHAALYADNACRDISPFIVA